MSGLPQASHTIGPVYRCRRLERLTLNMSYTPFKTMEAKLAKRPGVTNPAALTAYIARRKFGNAQLEQHAKAHTSMRNAKPLKKGKHHGQIAAFVKRNQKAA